MKPRKQNVKSRTWLRIAAALLALFAVMHTIGNVTDNQPPGSEKVLAAMRNFHFDAMGSDRTPWDFFRGLGLLVSADLAILTALTWQMGNLSETDPRRARPFVMTLMAANILNCALSWIYFFIAPVVLSGLTVLCLAAAALTLRREGASG